MKKYLVDNNLAFFTDSSNGNYFITITTHMHAISDIEMIERVWQFIVDFCRDNSVVIVHERIFASQSSYYNIIEKREEIFNKGGIDSTAPFSYICSKTIQNEGLIGIHIYGVSRNEWDFKNILYNGKKVGYKCSNKKMDMIILHSMYDDNSTKFPYPSPYDQTVNFFDATNKILQTEGFSFRNVCRTWIYLYEILEQYDEFNKARNKVFKDFGLLKDNQGNTEIKKIYMPASTGIEGGNVFKASGIMDVLALKPKTNDMQIFNETGKLQNSAFHYGSAFSRSMVINDMKKNQSQLYLSGTASIDKNGKSIFLNDIEKQIEKTFKVIIQLINLNNMTLDDMVEATVFLKSADYIDDFKQYCEKNDLKQMPYIITVADVCRDDLLFEMDATFKSKINYDLRKKL